MLVLLSRIPALPPERQSPVLPGRIVPYRNKIPLHNLVMTLKVTLDSGKGIFVLFQLGREYKKGAEDQ
jgi:hypothetical protein